LIQTRLIVAVLGNLPKELKAIFSKSDCGIKHFKDGGALEAHLLNNRIDICVMTYDQKVIDRLQAIDMELKFIIIGGDDTCEYGPNIFIVALNQIDKNFIFNLINFLRLTRIRDDFIGSLLHDARSPINSMIGYLELLENGVFGPMDEGQSKILFNIMTLGDMVIELIDDLNMLYQIDNKAFQLKIAPFSFTKILEEVLIAAWVQADKKDIKIHKEIAAPVPRILGDSGKIQRVIMNLMINAIKFSPEKSTITLGLKSLDDAHILFWISDEGPGIPPEEISSIFNKYYHNIEFSRRQRGFGLGLYISKYIIEAHHGQIGVQNNPVKGATFSFSLLKAD
jgi:signal transduction histidine kinase